MRKTAQQCPSNNFNCVFISMICSREATQSKHVVNSNWDITKIDSTLNALHCCSLYIVIFRLFWCSCLATLFPSVFLKSPVLVSCGSCQRQLPILVSLNYAILFWPNVYCFLLSSLHPFPNEEKSGFCDNGVIFR